MKSQCLILIRSYESSCVFFHQSGKYWGYKKYDREGISKLIGQPESIAQDQPILVQQTGVQGYLYKVGTFTQTAGSAINYT